MEEQIRTFKRWEDLDITDDFIFSRVIHDENICRQVVELILGVRIGKIHYLSAQDEHKTDPDSMRIIMDVFLRDENRIITQEKPRFSWILGSHLPFTSPAWK
ncbi:MAG: hypothetical protein IKB33_06290 [Spirochaetaceae bacterium]|nr:hypothetical protein [Spirochaetaceae bacterium]